MTEEELFMQRCIDLAQNGAGNVAPNPLVGAVIVHQNKIIGEGWHKKFGEAHAEVNAINSVQDKSVLSESTIYINLEPCSHHGKTPPCADLIIHHRFKKVVIGMMDPFDKVAGNGIKKLKDAGIEVIENVLKNECEDLNKRFITFHTKKRPYIILKWAQTIDGFIAPDSTKLSPEEFEQKRHITGFIIQKLVHKWRSEEDAIMVGTNSIFSDNPALNVRAWNGRNPVRICLDKNLRLSNTFKIFDRTQPTIIFTEKERSSSENLTYIKINFDDQLPESILEKLFQNNIQSIIIEGGKQTLETFINKSLWEEAQIFTSQKILNEGVKAPNITGNILHQNKIDNNQLTIYRNA